MGSIGPTHRLRLRLGVTTTNLRLGAYPGALDRICRSLGAGARVFRGRMVARSLAVTVVSSSRSSWCHTGHGVPLTLPVGGHGVQVGASHFAMRLSEQPLGVASLNIAKSSMPSSIVHAAPRSRVPWWRTSRCYTFNSSCQCCA